MTRFEIVIEFRSMFGRSINLLKSNSFFLFGARGTGKSTLIRQLLGDTNLLEIDLLSPTRFEQASFALTELAAELEFAAKEKKWIFIDEVQKVPKLLDVAQSLIDRHQAKIALTGSSARRLRRGGANLLAGRAYTYNLYPLTAHELSNNFSLNQYLSYGGLPQVWNIPEEERIIYLRSYITSYLKEEISEEQAVRNLEPFGRFLQVAAQTSGKIINYSNIARDVNVSDQTVKTYFQILEDTLLGFFLPAFNESIRKSQGKAPKFYLFDVGVIRALRRSIQQPLTDSTYEYGDLFEHFVISEIKRRAEYLGKDFQYSFIRTTNDKEIDLIVDRPGLPKIVVEIKSSTRIQVSDVSTLKAIGGDIYNAELLLISRDENAKAFDKVDCLPWDQGIEKVLG